MGFYVNPLIDKIDWLDNNGTRIVPNTWDDFVAEYPDCFPVCLIDNGWMTAAGIAYCKNEFEAFAQPDGRPKRWYAVAKKDLEPWYKEAA